MTKFMRVISICVLLAFTTGCIGQFALTKQVYEWNLEAVDNKFADELIFIVIAGVLPVYGIAAFIDSLIINSIEFWTGTNPMSGDSAVVGQTERVYGEKGTYADMTLKADGSINVIAYQAGKKLKSFSLHKGVNSVTAKSFDGEILAHASTDDLQPAL